MLIKNINSLREELVRVLTESYYMLDSEIEKILEIVDLKEKVKIESMWDSKDFRDFVIEDVDNPKEKIYIVRQSVRYPLRIGRKTKVKENQVNPNFNPHLSYAVVKESTKDRKSYVIGIYKPSLKAPNI